MFEVFSGEIGPKQCKSAPLEEDFKQFLIIFAY